MFIIIFVAVKSFQILRDVRGILYTVFCIAVYILYI